MQYISDNNIFNQTGQFVFAHHIIKTLIKVITLEMPTFLPTPGPEVIKLFPCSTQLSVIFYMLISITKGP